MFRSAIDGCPAPVGRQLASPVARDHADSAAPPAWRTVPARMARSAAGWCASAPSQKPPNWPLPDHSVTDWPRICRARVACRRRSSAEAAGRCWLLMARQRGRGGEVWPSGLFWIVGGCGQHYPRILPLILLTAEFHFTGPDGHERAICGLFCRRSLCPNRNGAPPRQPEEGAHRRRVQAALRSA